MDLLYFSSMNLSKVSQQASPGNENGKRGCGVRLTHVLDDCGAVEFVGIVGIIAAAMLGCPLDGQVGGADQATLKVSLFFVCFGVY